MNLVNAQYGLTLYIHPDTGPVSPLHIDMLSVETAVMGLDVNSNRDEARVRLLAEKIKDAFPEINVSGSLDQLARFMSRLSHVALFSGVVLRLPGTIAGLSLPANPSAEELVRLTQETIKLDSKLQNMQVLQTENERLKVEVEYLKNEVTPWINANKQQQRKVQEMAAERDDALRRSDEMNVEVGKYKSKMGELQQDNSALRLENERLKRENQKVPSQEKELATLRQEKRMWEEEKQDLNESLDKQRQELVKAERAKDRLQEEMETLRETIKKGQKALSQSDQSGRGTTNGFPGGGPSNQPYPQPLTPDDVRRTWLEGE